MKIIKYQIMSEANHGTIENPNIVRTFHDVEIRCSEDNLEANLAIAQAEANNGEVVVEDVNDPVAEPTQLDQIEAQVTYTAMMTDTLLEV